MPTMRAQLAEVVAGILPAKTHVIDHPREITTIDPEHRAVVMIVRTEFKPAPDNPLFEQRHDFEVWLIEPTSVEDGTSEDALDECADELGAKLTTAKWVTWTVADRTVFKDKWPAYRFTCSITSATN